MNINRKFFLSTILPGIIVVGLGILIPQIVKMAYFYYAVYVILQYIAMGSAWNLLSGYTGYVNFGSAGFFATGAYTSAMFLMYLKTNLFIAIIAGGTVSALLGILVGYLTIRVRGTYFAISTLAMTMILQMIVLNSKALGGGTGLRFIRPQAPPLFHNYMEFLFAVMLAIAFIAVIVSRNIEKSWIGRCFIAIKDSEEAAESCGVATFKLKLLATGLSGFLMGLAGAPLALYITYLEPYSAMAFSISVYAVAMPLVGGTGRWLGPIIGAVLLGGVQQLITVTISSQLNLLFLAVIIICFVTFAPNGILGIVIKKSEKKHGHIRG